MPWKNTKEETQSQIHPQHNRIHILRSSHLLKACVEFIWREFESECTEKALAQQKRAVKVIMVFRTELVPFLGAFSTIVMPARTLDSTFHRLWRLCKSINVAQLRDVEHVRSKASHQFNADPEPFREKQKKKPTRSVTPDPIIATTKLRGKTRVTVVGPAAARGPPKKVTPIVTPPSQPLQAKPKKTKQPLPKVQPKQRRRLGRRVRG